MITGFTTNKYYVGTKYIETEKKLILTHRCPDIKYSQRFWWQPGLSKHCHRIPLQTRIISFQLNPRCLSTSDAHTYIHFRTF